MSDDEEGNQSIKKENEIMKNYYLVNTKTGELLAQTKAINSIEVYAEWFDQLSNDIRILEA